ncbi:MAG: immunity 17 family protein [Planctomycetes bacterium]|nr:immunity 17 family protein [Planctomycetota bacterium]
MKGLVDLDSLQLVAHRGMISTDVLVGAVAIVLGAFFLLAAVFNWDWYFQLRKLHWIETRWSRTRARVVNVVLGLVLIGLGCAITMGFGPNKSSMRTNFLQPLTRDYDSASTL